MSRRIFRNTIGKKQEIRNKAILQKIARGTMLLRGLLPDFSAECTSELAQILAPANADSALHVCDLRNLLWASIDNDDSEDLDQLTVAEPFSEGMTRIRVAVADVDALVKKDSAIDRGARHSTTSVYTAAQTFPMLPLKLSNNLTSLNLNHDRMALVVEMTVGPDHLLSSRMSIEQWYAITPNLPTMVWLIDRRVRRLCRRQWLLLMAWTRTSSSKIELHR
jgi:exoribonuclease-2